MTRLLEQTLSSLEQLPTEELDALVTEALKLRASRNAPRLEAREAHLLEAIHHAVPAGLHARFETLLERRDQGTLAPEEHTELLRLTDEIENLEAHRVDLLGELARARGVGLDQLMRDLGLGAPPLRASSAA